MNTPISLQKKPSVTAVLAAPTALLDYPAAQTYLGGLSRSKLKALARENEVHVVRVGRRAMFRRDDLDAFIARKSKAEK